MVSPGRSTVSCRVPGYTKSWTGPLPTGDPQGDLYDQRDRVGELQPAQTHAASRRVPQRRGTDQTAVLGATQHQQEMDDADPRLEGSTEPIYDPIRGKASSAVNPIAGYTKICTPSYDGAGNLTETMLGLSTPLPASCSSTFALGDPGTGGSNPPSLADAVRRAYDARNRLLAVTFPDHKGDTSYTYTPNSL